jgi:glycosyltransferase involved in cell wall biosynthesis
MPKVLRIINRFNLGGPTYNVAYLSKYMAPEFETLLVGGANDASEASSDYILNKLGLEPIIIDEMRREINGTGDAIAYRKIKKLIKEFQPDIVHTHASKAGFLGRYAAINQNVPVIVHTFHGHIFHSYFNKYKTWVFKGIERKLANKTSKIIAISNKQLYELSDIHHIADKDKFTIIPLGFDLERFQDNYEIKRDSFRKEYNLTNDEIAIAIIGRLVPVKNHNLFIKAIKHVKELSNKKIRAFIVGDGELLNDLCKLVTSLGLTYSTLENKNCQADICFTSWIKDADYVFAGSDIVALTSFNEGTPVSLIEAQAANKPIVSTSVGGIEDVVIEGKTALLSPNNDIIAFAQNLNTLISDDNLRRNMSEAGYQYVKDKYHYTRLVSDMKELYHSLREQSVG